MMLKKLALISVAVCSSTFAGARVDLRPEPAMPAEGYPPNANVAVAVYLVDTGNEGEDVTFSHISFDLTDTFSQGAIGLIPQADAICCGCPSFMGWTSGACVAECFVCPNQSRPAWFDLEQNSEYVMPAGGELLLGTIQLQVGSDNFVLDVMNAEEPTVFHGAFAHVHGELPGEEFMWSAYTGELTGGMLQVVVNSDAPNSLVWSNPPFEAIDARQPTNIDGTGEFGWMEIQLEFASTVCIPVDYEFEVAEAGGDGSAPWVQWVTYDSPTEVGVWLSDAIDPGAWTTITHLPTGATLRLGYLPGDVNGDGTTSPVDILALIDSLNGVTERPIWSTDIDRSGVANPADILRLIDLLNGADGFDVWNGAMLP